MPLIDPIKVASLSPKEWLRELFIPPSMWSYSKEELKQRTRQLKHIAETEQKDDHDKPVLLFDDSPADKQALRFVLKTFLKRALIKAYPFDGYKSTTNKYISAHGDDAEYLDKRFNPLLFFAVFMGFPSRPDQTKEVTKYEATLAGETEPKLYTKVHRVPKLSFSQFLLGFVGGWHRGKQADKTIRLVQIPASFFKVVIFAVKWATWPFKWALNIIKLFTEVIPTFFADILAHSIGYEVRRIREKSQSKDKNKASVYFTRGLLIFFIALLYIPFYSASILGRAITAPLESAETAFATGRSIKIENWPWTSSILGIILGSIGIALSIGLTIASWSVGIPLVVGAAMTIAPAFFTPIVTWFLQLPLIGTSVGMIYGSLVPLSHIIGTAFTPYITAITGLAVGLQIPAEAIALGATLAVLVGPLGSLLSFVAGKLSDYWALAGKYGMFGVFTEYYFPPTSSKGYSQLGNGSDNHDDGPDKGHGKGPNNGDVPLPSLNKKGAQEQQLDQRTPPAKTGPDSLEIFAGADDDDAVSKTLDSAELDVVINGLNDMSPRTKALALGQQRKRGEEDADDATITVANAGRGASVEQSKRLTNTTRTNPGGRGKDFTGVAPPTGDQVHNKF